MYINKLKSNYIKSFCLINKNRGFVLGMAMIVLSVLLTLSIAITILLLRDFRQSSISYDSRVATALSDSAVLCAESILKNFRNAAGTESLFPTSTTGLVTHFSNDPSLYFPYVDPKTVGCFDAPIFPALLVDSGALVTSTTTSAYTVTNTITTSNLTAYVGGAKTLVEIRRSDFPRSACVELEVHATSTGVSLVIGRGRVPCDGASRVERVIVKKFD